VSAICRRPSADPAAVLRAVADLLDPCVPPDVAHGWDLCAHAEHWPCRITRAYWLATGTTPAGQL